MKQTSKTDFSAMTSPELAAVRETLKIVSNKTTIGFFVPVVLWEQQCDAKEWIGEKR